ncbi:synaptotagmin-like protein 5 isoform X1 [Trematomus bernacchii]|uniref:synaptotagmin-like protein 5 isoform X1 n=1 Tax=Trematomus bernacchii TaxID=40690 RepID=UPI00146B2AF4|nr:synaptotagmin-like protein 5 isoform X1 [Trematomus bernacchii]XP_033990317.1 synaptotagmin-like protein 5 isoform X1 [Trematomus bernacchii]
MEQVGEDLNLSYLLEHERDMILKVLQKDEKLRKREEKRIRKLKNELLEIKRKGSRRQQELGERQCARCLKSLGLIFDRGDLCEECQLRVCNDCQVSTPKARQWRCSICAKISELKVVTGEWFLEERSKRFEQGVPSGDVIKQTILSSPTITDIKSTENLSATSEPEKADTPKSKRNAVLNIVDGARRKGRMKMEKKANRKAMKPENGVDSACVKTVSDGDAQSVRSVCSAPSPRSNRGSVVALESSGVPTVPNNLRSHTPDRSSTLSDSRRVRPDGAESVTSVNSSDSVPETKATGHERKDSGTPTISVSRASVSSDHSRSEMDLSAAGSEPSEDAFSLRSRSVPGLNESEFSDEDAEEDIDALMSAHSKAPSRRISNALSSCSTPGSERRWGHLNVPDSDAETSSINSMMSMYSETGDYGNARVSGEILLNISYSYKTGALNVLVKECHNLATGDERRQRTDSYVKTYLLPDTSRQSKRKTSIKANTINPVFNENLRYVISHSQLETRTLQLSVWHHDRFGHNSFLGEVELTFDSWEFDSQMEDWYTLQPKVESNIDCTMQYKGELTVVLKYIPAEKNLTLPLDQVQVKKGFLKSKKASSFTLPKGGMVELLVKGAKNLTAVKSGGTSDPFVKGYLLPDSKKSTKHKTVVERRSVNPQWNHTFTYCGLQPGDLNNVCLELTVWDKEALASNVFLGGLRLGAGTGKSYGNDVDWMDSYGEEQRLWQRMIEKPEVPHECTLMLRSSMRSCNT